MDDDGSISIRRILQSCFVFGSDLPHAARLNGVIVPVRPLFIEVAALYSWPSPVTREHIAPSQPNSGLLVLFFQLPVRCFTGIGRFLV